MRNYIASYSDMWIGLNSRDPQFGKIYPYFYPNVLCPIFTIYDIENQP